MTEIWKDVSGYEGLYQISNLGNVKSVERIDKLNRKQGGFLLKQGKTKGYNKVELCKNGKVKSFYIHKLVAEAFIPNPDNLPEVGHKDEANLYNSDFCNNCVDNLYWTTPKENANTKKRKERLSEHNMGKNRYGKHYNSKKVICGGIVYDSVTRCAEYYNIDRRTFNSWLLDKNKMPSKFIKLNLDYYSE